MALSNKEKQDLQWKVRFMIGDHKSNKEIVDELHKLGFKKATIREYIKSFRKS